MMRAPRTPFVGSLSIHVLLLLILTATRHPEEAARATAVVVAQPSLVYDHAGGRRGGGGGGGEQRVAPVGRAKARGADRQNAPVARLQPTLRPRTASLDVDVPVLSAIPAYSATELVHGLIDSLRPATGSRGLGRDDGAGSGDGAGAGPDPGSGVGPGSQHGSGGGVYSLDSGVTPPILIRRVPPHYTSAAMSARSSGAVLLEFVVTAGGEVRDVRVLRSLDARSGLDEEAVKAVRQWRFRPGTLDGRPVAVRVTIELSFSIH